MTYMTTYSKTALIALAVVISAGTASAAHAQIEATMPTFYDQNGSSVNTGNGSLSAGTYYVVAGPSNGGHQVEYYGNGTYYDSTTGMYRGSVNNMNGTAGFSLGHGMAVGGQVSSASMPVLYDQNGAEMNTNGGYLAAGYYFVNGGVSTGGRQVYYFGNGTYYDAATMTYGGNTSNASGAARASLGN
jgi:hypothetical protein